MEMGETIFDLQRKREKARERERERESVWPGLTRNPTRNPRPWPGIFSRFRPPHRPCLVPIWSLEAARPIPAVLVAGNWPERRRFELENSRPRLVFAAVDFAGFWAHFQLGSTPHVTSIIFRPTSSPETAGLPAINHLGSSRFWTFDLPPLPCVGGHGHHRWTHRGLSYQTWASRRRRMNSGGRWPARVFR